MVLQLLDQRVLQTGLEEGRMDAQTETACSLVGELAALVAVVRYELQWANPVWDIASLDPSVETDQIVARVLGLLHGMEGVKTNSTDVSDAVRSLRALLCRARFGSRT